jgi:hypothetical protein
VLNRRVHPSADLATPCLANIRIAKIIPEWHIHE